VTAAGAGGLFGWWRGLAIAASLSTLALAALLAGTGLRPAGEVGPTAAAGGTTQAAAATPQDGMMAILTDGDARQTMLVSWPMKAASDGMVELRVRIIMDHPTMDAGTAWELWLMPRGAGGAPRSIGLIGIEAEQRLRVDASMLEALLDASGMVMSNEPAGGSPTGKRLARPASSRLSKAAG
jgi:anti-sigma-K factor RskA